MQVMIEEAQKQAGVGTNIDLGGTKTTTKELELFETNRKINTDLSDVVIDKSEKYEVVNIISNFQPIGYQIKGVTKNYAFLLAILGAGIMVLFLLFLQLSKYLKNYNS